MWNVNSSVLDIQIINQFSYLQLNSQQSRERKRKNFCMFLQYFIRVFLNKKTRILILTPANTTNIEIRAQTEAEKYFIREKLRKRPFIYVREFAYLCMTSGVKNKSYSLFTGKRCLLFNKILLNCFLKFWKLNLKTNFRLIFCLFNLIGKIVIVESSWV